MGNECSQSTGHLFQKFYHYQYLGKFKKYGFDLDTTTTSQVYGVSAEHKKQIITVDETNGELGYYGGEIASLFFHSESGGQTESSENIWGMKKPYLVGVPDSFSNRWFLCKLDLFYQQIKLRERGILVPDQSVGKINQISINERAENGRAKKITIYGTNGTRNFTKESFRRLIGSTTIKSMYFDLANTSSSFNYSSNELNDIFRFK